MPWKTVTLEELCERWGLDYQEHLNKHDLIEKITNLRKREGISQVELARRLGISQPRVARIESCIDADRVSFETLFKMFAVMGYTCRVSTRKAKRMRKAA